MARDPNGRAAAAGIAFRREAPRGRRAEGEAHRSFTLFAYKQGVLKKVLLFLIAALIAGDAVLLHGRYRAQVAREAEAVEHQVKDQDWSTPLMG
jgi:hypothetical protein